MTIGGPVCLWYASKHEVWLFFCLCSPPLLTNRQPTKSLHLPQSLSSELSSQSLSWSQTQRSGMQRRLSQRNSLSVHARGAEAKHERRRNLKISNVSRIFKCGLYILSILWHKTRTLYVQLLLCSELMSSLETNSLGISAATRGAVPPWLNPSHRFSVEKLHYHY